MNKFPSLNGRVIIVTGASRGLGREMALELADQGAKVVITGSSQTPELTEVTSAIPMDRVLPIVADVADPAAAQMVIDRAVERFGRVDVLINNAGRGMRLISDTFNTQPTKFWETDPAAWRSIIDINVNGAFNMARAAVPGMIEAGFGKVINISTSAQTMVRLGYAPYGPSKAALEAASRVWAQDLAGTGVDCNVYLPGGAADTDLLPPGLTKKGADGNLLPSDIMRRGIGWLCSDDSNGQTAGRYIARLWDTDLSPDLAAKGAKCAPIDHPRIM